VKAAALLVVVLVACGDDPEPVVVERGRLTAEITPSPAGIRILRDGTEIWATRTGAGTREEGPPHGFGATGSIAVDIQMSFGSYLFDHRREAEVWQAIDNLSGVAATAEGATFTLRSGETVVGTGALVFEGDLHVRIDLDTEAQRTQLAASLGPDEHLIGTGGMSFTVDHRGEHIPLWVQEDGITKRKIDNFDYSGPWILEGRQHSTHTPMPIVISSRGYALVLDTDARAIFDLGKEAGDTARYESWDPTPSYHLFVGDGEPGPAARDAMGQMLTWLGKPARPPLSIFAPWIDALLGSENVRSIANRLRTEGIAASVIWTEDWRGGEQTVATGYALHEDWRVDRDLYPDFEAVADDLHDLGYAFHTYHNTFIDTTADVYDEAIAGGYGIKNADGSAYEFTGVKFTDTTMLDLSNPAAVTWAKAVMAEGIPLGADGWMADFAEWLPTDAKLASGEDALAVHNRYPVDWAKLNQELFATPISGRPAPIYFMRAAWLHSQKYVQVVWAGDQQTDFTEGDGMPSVVPIGLGLGVTGFPYFGHDIGGYMSQNTVPTSEELFYRWTTFGALSPVMRTHHGREIIRNVQWFANAGTVAHFRRWTRLHMQLASYLWGSIGEYEATGAPLFRMIALDYPDEDWGWTSVDEYLLGDRILVAPVLAEGATSREVKLPAGTWYPLLGGAAVSGTITATAARTEIPAFVPAGTLLVLFPDGLTTVLPTDHATTTTLEDVGDDRELWLWPGTPAKAQYGQWHHETGIVGTPDWAWAGRPEGLAPPTTAMFNGAAITLTVTDGVATGTVTGDGTVELPGGGTLTIARGKPAATTTFKVH